MLKAVNDAVQHRWVGIPFDRSPLVKGEQAHEKEAEEEDDGAAPENLPDDGGIAVSARAARREREVSGNSDDKEEERENEIRRCPPVPWRVTEWREERAPASGVVHQQHCGDGQAAENVERQQALPNGSTHSSSEWSWFPRCP